MILTDRDVAIATLESRMCFAPNFEHYRQWLSRQPTQLLLDLVDGRPVHSTNHRYGWIGYAS